VSAAPSRSILVLPLDPDAGAAAIRAGLRAATAADEAVVIIDSSDLPWLSPDDLRNLLERA
jgi:F420-0:gamma-glutamyl ligase